MRVLLVCAAIAAAAQVIYLPPDGKDDSFSCLTWHSRPGPLAHSAAPQHFNCCVTLWGFSCARAQKFATQLHMWPLPQIRWQQPCQVARAHKLTWKNITKNRNRDMVSRKTELKTGQQLPRGGPYYHYGRVICNLFEFHLKVRKPKHQSLACVGVSGVCRKCQAV